MEAMAADIAPYEWTDQEWAANLHRVVSVLASVRGMTLPTIADAMPMARSTFYDKLKKGSFTALELRRMARVLDVPPAVFYEPVDALVGGLRTGRFASWLSVLPTMTGQGTLLSDELEPFDFFSRPELAAV